MGAKRDGKVIQEVFVKGKADQKWYKGSLDAQGYFTLSKKIFVDKKYLTKYLTAISEKGLEIKGNINMRRILLVDYLLIFYHVLFFKHRSYI